MGKPHGQPSCHYFVFLGGTNVLGNVSQSHIEGRSLAEGILDNFGTTDKNGPLPCAILLPPIESSIHCF
jgi:hypothetical protein